MLEPKFPHVSVALVGHNGNAFNVIGKVSKAFKAAGEGEAARDFTEAAFASESYDDLLRLAMKTVDVS